MRGREDIFLSMSDSEKMSLFRRIVNARVAQTPVADRLAAERAGKPLVNDVNLKQIASLTGRNYGSVYNTYNGLVEALETMIGRSNLSIKKLFSVPSSDVRWFFVKSGHPYKFLDAILYHHYDNFEQFLAAEDTSKATMLRHLKAIRDFGREFGVRFSYKTMSVQGDPKRIRLFLTMIFWLATDGAQWPFTNMNREFAAEWVDRSVELYGIGTPNNVTREIAMYYVAVSHQRNVDAHTLDYRETKSSLYYPVANMFEEIGPLMTIERPAGTVDLSVGEQIGESVGLYFLYNFLPFYATTNQELLDRTFNRFKRYNPEVYNLVNDFLLKLPVSFLEENRLPQLAYDFMKANLLSTVVSVIEFGDDLSLVVAEAINNRLDQIPQNELLEKKVRQTIEHIIFSRNMGDFEKILDQLVHSFYQTTLMTTVQYFPPVKVKVAPVIEQTVLGYMDLLAFLTVLPFVEIISAEGNLASADLVIESSTVPGADEKRGDALVFKWAASSSNDWYGELYATVRQLWDEKMSLGGAVDY